MGLRVNHNTNSVNTHRNLLANDHSLSQTVEKLSSGMQINRASDGPATLVISEQMRAQVAGLGQAIENSETAVSMIQTTEANLAEVNTLLTRIRQLAIHASNEGVNDELTLKADQDEIVNLLNTIDLIAKQARFGNKHLLDGSNGASGVTTGENLEFVTAGLDTKGSESDGFAVRVIQSATKASLEGEIALTQEIIDQGETLTVIENGKKASYTTNEYDSLNTIIRNLKLEIDKNGLQVNPGETDNGKIKIEHNKFGSGYGFQALSSTQGILSDNAGKLKISEPGVDIKGTINGEISIGKGRILTGIRGDDNVDGLSVRYTGIIEEGDSRSGEIVGYAHVSQGSLNFQVGGNKEQTVSISVGSVNTENLGRGIENKSGFSNLRDIDVRTFTGAQDTLLLVDKVINQITSKRGELGTFQKNNLEGNLANLRVANENLISSESVIRDTDIASKMAAFTRDQIMTQSATAMMAQANQTPQEVLLLVG